MRRGRYIFRLMRQSQARGPSGENVESWHPIAYLQGSLMPLSGREYVAAGAERSEVTHRMVVRKERDVPRPADRLAYGNEEYDVMAVLDDDRRRSVEVMAKVVT